MGNIIYDHLADLQPGEFRTSETERLLRVFQYYGDEVLPSGYSSSFRPDVTEHIEQRRQFFDDMDQLLGDDAPPLLGDMRMRFERNLTQMKKLAEMKEHERNRLPVHEIFPFYDDFDHAVRVERLHQWGVFTPHIKFEPNFIAKGAFASIYRVEDADGRQYALKLFKSRNQIFEFNLETANKFRRYIFENVKERRELFSEPPFTAVRAATSSHEHAPWYLMDYFDGESVRQMIDRKHNITDDRNMTRRIIIGYAEMLQKLHRQGLVFMDNSWGSVLVNEESVAICDFDLVRAVDDPDIKETLVAHAAYRSRELQTWNPPTYHSELESLALMIDHLFFGKPILHEKNERYHRKLAEKNKRTYHPVRRKRLPSNLQQVVAPLINLPRDETITLDDFIEAAKLDLA